ncbi:inactive RHOMBOID-like protein 8 [Tasmannia lanceolata]|uniref:inactive RHOMBOID-like protein 8 n=1 Tax=Tasmannia lanceolata TaxID=3420 RepID=UPI0040636F0C
MAEEQSISLQIKALDPIVFEENEESHKEEIFFFGSRFQRKENTWVISFFVVIHMVAFIVTMFINNCPQNSHGDCMMKSLRRFSFQPITENPLVGPSSSTLIKMGALQWTLVMQHHQRWRIVTCLWLHAGVTHLVVNLSSVMFVGVHLEQMFGPLRIGIIYLFSAFLGSFLSTLFVQYSPSVGSSGALFGLLGSMLSGLIQNWGLYADKFAALLALSVVAMTNFSLGLLPHVDNFSNIGGFISGILLGCVLLFTPQPGWLDRNKGIFEFKIKSSDKLKKKLDKPALRILSLALFGGVVAGLCVAILHRVNVNEYCRWCHYIDCIPCKRWSCNGKPGGCEAKVSEGRLTLTCKISDKFQIYPFADISQARVEDLCSQICS